jgi:hypothetical protein
LREEKGICKVFEIPVAWRKSLKSIKFINLADLNRLAAILLLGILGFNWCGYQLLSAYLEDRADRQLEARLDDNRYDDTQLFSIKVASHLSYSSPSLKFERIDGQIEVGGVLYKYVKRRLYNDSVELLCIPDHEAMNLQTAKNDFFQLVNDLQHNGQGKKMNSHPGNTKSPTSPDYIAVATIFAIANPNFIGLSHYADCDAALPFSYSDTDEQPPDHSCLIA